MWSAKTCDCLHSKHVFFHKGTGWKWMHIIIQKWVIARLRLEIIRFIWDCTEWSGILYCLHLSQYCCLYFFIHQSFPKNGLHSCSGTPYQPLPCTTGIQTLKDLCPLGSLLQQFVRNLLLVPIFNSFSNFPFGANETGSRVRVNAPWRPSAFHESPEYIYKMIWFR